MADTTSNARASEHDSISSRATEKAHEAVDRLGAHGAQAEERLRETGERVSQRSQDLGRELSGYIKDKPLASLGVAAAAGFLLATLLRRRS
jgi:ElaB/YqjD/DUF883 family membrane-anchored ribosome-binding protein